MKALESLGDQHLIHKRVIELAEKYLCIYPVKMKNSGEKAKEPIILDGQAAKCSLYVNKITTIIDSNQVKNLKLI